MKKFMLGGAVLAAAMIIGYVSTTMTLENKSDNANLTASASSKKTTCNNILKDIDNARSDFERAWYKCPTNSSADTYNSCTKKVESKWNSIDSKLRKTYRDKC